MLHHDAVIDKPEVLANIQSEFFKNSVIQLQTDREGQSVDNGNVIIGCKAGPSLEVSNLLHEMSHLVEIDKPRLTQFGWGLKNGTFWQIGNQSGYVPHTNQSVLREMRVWAFQYNIEQHLGINTTIKELVSAATYLPAFCYMGKTDKLRFSAIAKGVKKDLKKYSYKVFVKEWFERVEYLENRK